LAITWKVADNVYQHIDVLELDKENEFAVGKILKVANKYTYSDLDDLIVNHVTAMARKVNEMVNDEKFRKASKEATGKHCPTVLMSTTNLYRKMAGNIHRSQSKTKQLPILYQPQIPWLLLPHLQSRSGRKAGRVAGQGGAECV
jgi:hypothetical protein